MRLTGEAWVIWQTVATFMEIVCTQRKQCLHPDSQDTKAPFPYLYSLYSDIHEAHGGYGSFPTPQPDAVA